MGRRRFNWWSRLKICLIESIGNFSSVTCSRQKVIWHVWKKTVLLFIYFLNSMSSIPPFSLKPTEMAVSFLVVIPNLHNTLGKESMLPFRYKHAVYHLVAPLFEIGNEEGWLCHCHYFLWSSSASKHSWMSPYQLVATISSSFFSADFFGLVSSSAFCNCTKYNCVACFSAAFWCAFNFFVLLIHFKLATEVLRIASCSACSSFSFCFLLLT